MTSSWHRDKAPRRCTCCGEMRTPPVCHPCDALLPPREYPQASLEQVVTDGDDWFALRADGSGRRLEPGCDYGPATTVEFTAEELARYRWLPARQQPGSKPTDTTRE